MARVMEKVLTARPEDVKFRLADFTHKADESFSFEQTGGKMVTKSCARVDFGFGSCWSHK